MAKYYASANPTKRFFIEMLIRDISLEDAILDLIDNCIDGYSRQNKIDLSSSLVTSSGHGENKLVNVNFDNRCFVMEDNCGGIDFKDAEKHVFRFGRDESHEHSALSVYGIGLKRAIFKIGRNVEITSRTTKSGFRLKINVDDWLNEDKEEKKNIWRFPLEKIEPVKKVYEAGTKIVIKGLREEIKARLSDSTVEKSILKSISEAYPLFLNKHLKIKVNKLLVEGRAISFSRSENINYAMESWDEGDVHVELFCGLRPKDDLSRNVWKSEYSGWNILCNGRVVVNANKGELTGWGIKGSLPEFQPKHRGFTGFIFFSSSHHPEKLPWNTTKRGLNQESLVFLRTKQKMITHGKDIIRMLDKVYQSNDDISPSDNYKMLTEGAESVDVASEAEKMRIAPNQKTVFAYSKPVIQSEDQTTKIQYSVKRRILDKVRNRLKKRNMSAKAIGEHTFKYFIDRECD